LNVGEVSEIFRSPFGFHIAKLYERKAEGVRGLSEVRKEILAARALVLPSFAEGLPVVIMEAMALRRPVLTTYIAGIPELVRHGENGWLFPAGSVCQLASAMEQCLSLTPEEIQTMGDAGHDLVVERHLIDSEAAKLSELFREDKTHTSGTLNQTSALTVTTLE